MLNLVRYKRLTDARLILSQSGYQLLALPVCTIAHAVVWPLGQHFERNFTFWGWIREKHTSRVAKLIHPNLLFEQGSLPWQLVCPFSSVQKQNPNVCCVVFFTQYLTLDSFSTKHVICTPWWGDQSKSSACRRWSYTCTIDTNDANNKLRKQLLVDCFQALTTVWFIATSLI